MGLFGGSTKQSSATSSGLSQSGFGAFTPKNRIYANNQPLVDFTNPTEIAGFGGLILLGWFAWKRIK